MKSFGNYIAKYLASFAGLLLILLFINGIAFGWTFYGIVTKDYGELSPQNMLETTAASASLEGIPDEAARQLRDSRIWAVYLDMEGNTAWEAGAPEGIPEHFTVQDAAVFAKGYLAGYPVFIRNTDDGMLILGYPRDSYMKLPNNYYSLRSVKIFPFFAAGILAADLAVLFLAYYYSKRKILKNTEPVIASIVALGTGRPVSLSLRGELSGIADSVNKASDILRRQDQARANWISGVSHDIRTPLSMIMGYSGKIACDDAADDGIRAQAEIIKHQSLKIKSLVEDLNLVSRLEYDMQPLHREPVRLSRLLRSYTAELLNEGASESHPVELRVSPSAETAVLDCDARLISRAVGNLVQNSIRHNPEGCWIVLGLDRGADSLCLSVSDNGAGLSAEKWKELTERPHYLESTDDRLDLRHGLGLLLVRQIAEAHGGTMEIESEEGRGCRVSLVFTASNRFFMERSSHSS